MMTKRLMSVRRLAALLLALPVSARPGGGPAPAAPVHDPAHPPIDCPLAAQGVNPSAMRPFEETEKYIAFLERADRALWQKPDEVVKALALRGTETVEDVGAGSGYFTFRFSRALPGGKVIATDIDPEMVRHIHHKVLTDGALNVTAVLAKPDDPGISSDADLVFIADVIHHVENREAWLSRAYAEMKPGARLVVVEFKEGKLPEGPPESVKIPKAKLVAMLEGVGFRLAADDPKLLPFQTFLSFEKPAAPAAGAAARR
jgi:ubiquinone/menaquinone biosynthesis C-methylase UbiE